MDSQFLSLLRLFAQLAVLEHAQRGVLGVVFDLIELDRRLGGIATRLRQAEFRILPLRATAARLSGAIEVVRGEALAEAVEALLQAAVAARGSVRKSP